MDAAAELGRNPVSKHQIRHEYGGEQADAGRDCRNGPVPRDQIFRHERGQGNIRFPCSADHGQNWQPYPVDPHSCYSAVQYSSTSTVVVALVRTTK